MRKSLALLAAPASLFAIACGLEVYQFNDPLSLVKPAVYGLEVLLLGWLGPIFGELGWYANLPFVLGLAFYAWGCVDRGKRWPARVGLGLAAVALALGGTTLLARTHTVLGPHGGVSRNISGWGVGLYAWLGSFLALAAICLRAEVAERSARSNGEK